MHIQDDLAVQSPRVQREDNLFSWLQALRTELTDRGIAVGIPRQLSDADIVGYRQELTCPEGAYALECRLVEEHGLVLRVSFLDAANNLVMSYRVNLGADCDVETQVLARRLREARRRIPLMAKYFDQARLKGTLMH